MKQWDAAAAKDAVSAKAVGMLKDFLKKLGTYRLRNDLGGGKLFPHRMKGRFVSVEEYS